MQLSKLYAITDRGMIQRSLAEDIAAAIEGGAGMIQLREKNISDEEYTAVAKDALAVCRKMGALLIINDNPHVCVASGADGVHLGQGDMDLKEARALLGEKAIIGATAKTLEQVIDACNSGVDYIGSGAVFGTATKSDAIKLDFDTLKRITELSTVPVYAIGGINRDNIGVLKNSGIYGVAVVSGVFRGNIIENARALKKAVEEL